MVDVGAIRQDHIGNGPSILVFAECLKRDFFPIDQCRSGLLRSLAISLAFLRAIDAVEADAFVLVVVQDLNRVAVEDGDGGAGGSHTLKRQGRRFVIETDAVSLRSVLLFTVVSVGKLLQHLSSEKYDV